MPTRLILVFATAALAALGGYFAYGYIYSGQAGGVETSRSVDLEGEPLVGQRRPDYTLGSADGALLSATDFDGKVVLVNFWATWCAPCREEMPMLMALRDEYAADGLEVVGVALDDVQRARDFAAELQVEYPILVGSTDVMALMALYGNVSGTLPYTVLIDRDGVIRWTKLGVLKRDALEREIASLLPEV